MDGPKARDQATSIKTASLKSIQVRNYISQAPEDVPNVIEKFSRRVDFGQLHPFTREPKPLCFVDKVGRPFRVTNGFLTVLSVSFHITDQCAPPEKLVISSPLNAPLKSAKNASSNPRED